jgi:hypothetical protein
MIKKFSLILDNEFYEYCRVNKIEDQEKLAKKIFDRGFAIEKYGEIPKGLKGNEKVIEKEVIIEKIVEIVKEVPIIKEVSVVKEVPVEKEVIVTKTINDGRVDELLKENEQLKSELKKITDSLEKMNRATYLKNSDLNSLYGE